MKISDKSEYDCRTCVLGKQTNSRNRKPDIRATEPMQFIHTDLSGAVDPVSRDGFRYGLTFTISLEQFSVIFLNINLMQLKL